MNLVNFIEVLIPVGFTLTYLEPVELRTSLLILLEPLHQVFCCAWNEEVSYPEHIGIHVFVFAIIQQVEC